MILLYQNMDGDLDAKSSEALGLDVELESQFRFQCLHSLHDGG